MDQRMMTFPVVQSQIVRKLAAEPPAPLTPAEQRLVAMGLDRMRLLLQDSIQAAEVYNTVQECGKQ
jgi:hypothetical protein